MSPIYQDLVRPALALARKVKESPLHETPARACAAQDAAQPRRAVLAGSVPAATGGQCTAGQPCRACPAGRFVSGTTDAIRSCKGCPSGTFTPPGASGITGQGATDASFCEQCADLDWAGAGVLNVKGRETSTLDLKEPHT